MNIPEAIEQLQKIKQEIRNVSDTHSLKYRGGRALEIIGKIKPNEGQDAEELEGKKRSAAEAIHLSLDRETNWAMYSHEDSRKKKSKSSAQTASNDLQHAVGHVIDDIDEFIDRISE
ncbi:hypothetical protein [Hymenobacter canadensis]|uniref:Uncharacterized protein n=1 Tax=Hymenobacter canadensis TaxID=2999067 RepID=A0ABY7LRZ1_9BACT|nr:hypothetical protein [Hymenobacter canadensis]WBA43187.1 hypothetical protein O3303_06385 [Hymenobacter canadensis]